jgi:restriction endonuclease S subunit
LAIDEKQIAVASATGSGVPDGWREVRFDEIAQLVNDRVDNPAEAGVERYVGLEHLDPESLRIRRWGAPTDVEAQKLRFQPCDIIFGKRRAYQRKVAVADFEGICSAHAMVLRAREETVVKEFLPFFMQSDTFFDRALSISVGSLSPTINWKTLAGQKFALPSKAEQRRITDILWAADDSDYKSKAALERLKETTIKLMNMLLTVGVDGEGKVRSSSSESDHSINSPLGRIPQSWEVCSIEDKLEKIIDYRGKTPRKTSSGVPLITAKNVREGFIDEDPREFIATEDYDSWMTRGIPKPGDVLFTTEAPLGNVAKIPNYKMALAQRIITLCPNREVLDSEYLYWLLMWSESQRRIQQKGTGTTVLGIKQSVFRKIFFRFPPIEEQRKIVSILKVCDAGLNVLERQSRSASLLRKLLLLELIPHAYS